MGGLLSEMWRRLQSAWRSWRRMAPPRDVVDAGMRQGELEDGGNSEGGCLEKGVREVDTGAAQQKAEQGGADGGGSRPVETEPCGVEAPGDRVPSGEIAANDGELAEQESVEQEGAEREPAEEKRTEQEPWDQERAQGEIVAGEEDTAQPEGGSTPTRRGGRRKPVKRGGTRRGAQEKPPPGDSGRSRTPVRVARARVVCRKRTGMWEVAVVPAPGVVVRGETESPSSGANGEFLPTAFRSVAQIEDEAGGQMERVSLYVDEPMVFRLGADWQGEGRKVGGVGVGHFIVIAPAEWTRLGDAPVDAEACVDTGFRAHYFFADRGDGQAVEGFAERGVSSSIIALDGDRVFDESDQGGRSVRGRDRFTREQDVVVGEGSQLDVHRGQRTGALREQRRQRLGVGQRTRFQAGVEFAGQGGLATALVGQRQESHRVAAGGTFAAGVEQRFEGAPVRIAGEQLVAVDQVAQRHGLAPQGMYHVPVVHDMAVAAVGPRVLPRGSVISGVVARNSSRRSS